jgi:RNA polymerase sigma-70 factor, ECF subfamily
VTCQLQEPKLSAGVGSDDVTVGSHAFADVYREHVETALAVVLALRGVQVGAEDLVQEAFARAYERWHEVGRMDRPDLWVQRVALNLATSRLRRLTSEQRALARLGGRREQIRSDSFEREQHFWDLVRRLPARQARVVALRYAGDLSMREIAEVVGVAEGTVKAQLHTARNRLEALLSVAGRDREERS